MSKVTYYQPVPSADRVVNANGLANIIWLRWFQFVAQMLGRETVQTVTYDPASIAAGAKLSTAVPFTGAVPGDRGWATFTGVQPGITIVATPTADLVTVVFENVTGLAIDMASGTLAVGVEKRS